MTYTEKSTQVVLESQIAVMVLLNPDSTDMEMWPLRPRQAATTMPEEFAARKLRAVGVAGLCGAKAICAFKEPLDPTVVGAIGTAFAEYIGVLLGDSIAVQIEERQKGDEVAWLEQLHQLPDTRMN
jgi:hypothetical protein